MKDGVHGDTGSCRKERGKFGMVFPRSNNRKYYYKWCVQRCLKGLNPCYQKIDGQMTTVSVKWYSCLCFFFSLFFIHSGYYTNHQCFILDQRLICVSIFLFNAKCTVGGKKKKPAYRVNSEISHKLWDQSIFFFSLIGAWGTHRAKSRYTASLHLTPIICLQHKNEVFCPLWDGIVIPNSCLKIGSHPLSQCCAQQWHPCKYRVDQHWKWGGLRKISDIYAWVGASNTFGLIVAWFFNEPFVQRSGGLQGLGGKWRNQC